MERMSFEDDVTVDEAIEALCDPSDLLDLLDLEDWRPQYDDAMWDPEDG